jgi:Secretion system C-terminal sorting domain
MKQLLYTFLFCGASAVLFLNNSSGRAADAGIGNTGAPGDAPVTCQSCHAAGTFGPPTMRVELYDSTNTTKLTSYRPGLVHVVRVTTTGTNVPAAGGYGFQMIDIRKTGNTALGGILPTVQQTLGTNVKATTLAGTTRTYAEHRGGKSAAGVFNVRWRAPAVSTGAVTFYAAGNVVNGDGGQSGDGSANTTLEVTEGRVSTNDLAAKIRFDLSPNPVADQLTMSVNSSSAHVLTIHILNLAGQTVLSEKWQIGSGNNAKTLDVKHLATGAYMVQVVDNQDVLAKKVLKL